MYITRNVLYVDTLFVVKPLYLIDVHTYNCVFHCGSELYPLWIQQVRP